MTDPTSRTHAPNHAPNGRTAAAARRLRALHHAHAPLVLPNAWDAASARVVEEAGALALGGKVPGDDEG